MNGENLELFERYFNQEMDEVERKEFELRLERDKNLKKEFDEYRSIYDAIGDKEVMELRKHLKKLGDKHREGRMGGRIVGNGTNWFWLAALLIVSLSIVSVTYLWVSSPMTPQLLGMRIGSQNIQRQIYSLEPAYEELIRYRVRSENFRLEHPRDSLVVKRKSDLQFRWAYYSNEKLYLDVMDKSGKVLVTVGPLSENNYTLKRNFQRGIYVYRFRTSSDTLFTGLFYVV